MRYTKFQNELVFKVPLTVKPVSRQQSGVHVLARRPSSDTVSGLNEQLEDKKNKWQSHTVAYLLHNKRVKANLVHALVQAVGLVDLPQLLVKDLLLGVRQLRAQNPVVELLCGGGESQTGGRRHKISRRHSELEGLGGLPDGAVFFLFVFFNLSPLSVIFKSSSSSFFFFFASSCTLTDCEAKLEHMYGPFLLQEVHVTKKEVLLFSDFLQLQLQHLVRGQKQSEQQKTHQVQRQQGIKQSFETGFGLQKTITDDYFTLIHNIPITSSIQGVMHL